MVQTVSKHWRQRAGTLFECYKGGVTASRGVVTSNHPMASAAGMQMLAKGGNAVDAAIATAFALTVVEPAAVGLFGAGFINMCDAASGKVTIIDNYAVAPLKATHDMFTPVSDSSDDYLEVEGQKNKLGHMSVGVPGALKAWCHVAETYGHLGLRSVIQPAEDYARRGFPASAHLCQVIANTREDLARFQATADVFLPGGEPPQPGQLIVRSDYAATLALIAEEGPDALYRGDIGKAVVRDMEANGGIITMEDLEAYQFKHREPVRGTYRGYEVVSTPPTSSGGTHIVQALNILEEFDVTSLGYGTSQGIHILAEVLKVCFGDRFRYMGDPDRVDVPVNGLISKEYAALRRNEIDLMQVQEHSAGDPASYLGESADTTHLTVMDIEGNVVAMTQTIHAAFGSKVTTPGTGMLLNNTMYLFDPHTGNANSIEPGKRMLSSMSPTIVFKDEKPFLALGTPGGTRIFASVLQAIINVVDHGMTIQEAVEAPRVWTQGQSLEVEEGVSSKVREELEQMGHMVQVVPRVAGGMNGVMLDPEAKLLYGAACWRADGAPVGYGGGNARPGGSPLYRL